MSRNQMTTRNLGKKKVSELRSQTSELESTKKRLIYELATKSDNGKPTGGEMDRKQVSHLVGDLRRTKNERIGVHYCVG